MADPVKKSKSRGSSKSSPDPLVPQTPLPEDKSKPLYELENIHPNRSLPAYRPPSTQPSESPFQTGTDPSAQPRRLRRKPKKEES